MKTEQLPYHLVFVSDDSPGYTRRRRGKGFSYYDEEGRVIRDAKERARLAALAVPPAWVDVWLCPTPKGHLQATGRDARSRKQYRYHPDFRAYREGLKFDQLAQFGRALGGIRKTLDRILSNKDPADLEYVVALVVRLLDRTGFRIGSETYLRQNGTSGLVTLSAKQVVIKRKPAAVAEFDFTAKGGKRASTKLAHRKLVSRLRALQDLPGQRLFRYQDASGEFHDLTSEQVNAFLADITGEAFTAKDFRTWTGTRVAAECLAESGEKSDAQALKDAVEEAAKTLGNTKAMARKSYIHPRLAQPEARRFFQSVEDLPEKKLPQIDRLSRLERAMVSYLS